MLTACFIFQSGGNKYIFKKKRVLSGNRGREPVTGFFSFFFFLFFCAPIVFVLPREKRKRISKSLLPPNAGIKMANFSRSIEAARHNQAVRASSSVVVTTSSSKSVVIAQMMSLDTSQQKNRDDGIEMIASNGNFQQGDEFVVARL